MTASLAGVRVVLTRPVQRTEDWAKAVSNRDGTPVCLPLIGIVLHSGRLVPTLSRLAAFDILIVTSGNAVRALERAAAEAKIELANIAPVCYVVGASTGRAAAAAGLRVVHPQGVNGARDLAEAIANRLDLPAGRALYLRGGLADSATFDLLRERGWVMKSLICYDTYDEKPDVERWRQALADPGWTVVTLASPSAVQVFVRAGLLQLAGPDTVVKFAYIGKVTAASATNAGLPPGVVADSPSAEGLLRAVEQSVLQH